ncbi:hypothetical protein CBL_21388 [Carabus blaptoides fortunei]
MESEHEHLLLHAEVRWLSRGRVLKRLFELREEVQSFLCQKNSELSNFFRDNNWVAKLSYLSDIFSLINELNLSLQENNTTVFNLYNKIDAFKKKLILWNKRIQEDNYDMFDSLSDLINSEDLDVKCVNHIVCEHLQALSCAFNEYYPPEEDRRIGNMWIKNPFIDQKTNRLNDFEQENLIELSSDWMLMFYMKRQCGYYYLFRQLTYVNQRFQQWH